MAFLYILCAFLLLTKVNCNPTPVFEASIESNVTEAEEVFQTTTLNTLINDTEIIETIAPQLETTDSDIESNKDCSKCIDAKFLNHYYAKGCKPIPNSNGCDNCPKKFDCNQKTNITLGNNECVFNGNKYRIGESVPVPNPCQVCQCGYGFDARYDSGGGSSPLTTIHCITVECPEHFAVHSYPVDGIESDFEKVKNCYNVYENGKCCSVRKECPDTEKLLNSTVCLYNNKVYQIGEKIYPNEDKCKACICDENWDPSDPINNSGCYQIHCNLEIDYRLREGCIPIYHEQTCCPIDYYCPEREKQFTPEFERREMCHQELDSGPCLGYFKRFYFDGRDGQCNSFVYGGCGGNDNNFRDIEECEQTCGKSNVIENESETNEKISEDLDLISNSTTDIEDVCLFNGDKYSIGHHLDIGQKCVNCECRIPPDFTCIHRSCPPPLSDRCKATYDKSSCCPILDCSYEEKISDRSFDPQSCPTPMCAEGCYFETYPDRCPDCVCVPIVEVPVMPAEGVSHEVPNL